MKRLLFVVIACALFYGCGGASAYRSESASPAGTGSSEPSATADKRDQSRTDGKK